MPERLTPLDASFLYLEKPHLHMHVGGLAVFDPTDAPRGPLTFERLRVLAESRIGQVPRWRQRVLFPPFNSGRPVWADDPNLDVEDHLRHVAVAPPGGPRQLADLIGELHSQQLDREKPLWEMSLIDGLQDGYQAVLTKTHHAMLDGVGGMDLAMMLFDLEPDPPEIEPEEPLIADPWPSPVELVRDALLDRVREPIEAIRRTFQAAARSPRDLLKRGTTLARGAIQLLGRGLAPSSPLNAGVEGTRRFAMTEIPLEEARAVGHALGGKVNDVFLALVAGALGRVLERRREPTEGRSVRTMMPASTRADDQHGGTLGNKVTTLFIDLPIGPMDPAERIRLVHDRASALKESHQGEAASALIDAAMWAPPGLHRMAARFGNDNLRIMNLVASNIPGPQMPLYLGGTRLVAYYPLMPLGANAPLSVAMISMAGVLGIGFTGDWTAFPDLELLAGNVLESFDELKKVAGI
jgi:WS/DGAT/MGAT family acyltransferase